MAPVLQARRHRIQDSVFRLAPESWERSSAEKGIAMKFYCEFTWFPGTTRRDVAERLVHQHEAGSNNPDKIQGWYNLVGGGAGFLIVDYDDPKELTAFLQPYMDIMSFDVRAITENSYEDTVREMQHLLSSGEDRPPIAL
jgi:hypothetical protein